MFARAVATALFVCVFLVFCYKIVMRYAVGDAVAWADEISVVLFVWIVFLTNGFVLEDRRQITFDLIYRNLSVAPCQGSSAGSFRFARQRSSGTSVVGCSRFCRCPARPSHALETLTILFRMFPKPTLRDTK